MRTQIPIAALALSFFAAACSPPAVPSVPESREAPATKSVPASQPVAAAPAAAPAVAAPAAPSAQALASEEGEFPGSRVEITELKRNSSGTVTLKFTMFNDSDEEIPFTGHRFGDPSIREDYYSVGAVHLLDPANKKKYLVVRDSTNQCLCSTNVPKLVKSKVSLWAKFPAPPEDVKTVTVVIPHFPPFDDLVIR